MPDLATIGTAVVTSGVVTAVVQAWISKAIEHRYETNLERMRADIRLDAFRNETKFARLHETRADAISKVYASLRFLRGAIGDYTNAGVQTERWPELRQQFSSALQAAHDVFNPNEIYVPASTADKIRNYLIEISRIAWRFRMEVDNEAQERREFFRAWADVSQQLNEEMRLLFEELRDEFRQLLGDDAPPAPTPAS